MSQHDYIIDNQDGASFRADINSALQAIASQNSGATEPSQTFAYQFWVDTSNGLLKQRNSTNSGWITVATIGKTLVPDDSTQLTKAWVNFNGTGTVAIRGSYNVTSITDNNIGDYTVNFATPMPDTNYAISGLAKGDNANSNVLWVITQANTDTNATGSVRIKNRYQTTNLTGASDPPDVNLAVFR